ncbi:MAG: YeeE/YedE family protein [Methylocystis sp.]|nr:YeeE/YedE family protein [Methylocystis sp.]
MLERAMIFEGLMGGLMIGGASALMLLGLGRIAGVSGMFGRATGLSPGSGRKIAIAFILGLPIGAAVARLIAGGVELHPPSSYFLMAGGFLVGFGARLGSGCTSGHGICGMARFSKRSIAATTTFIATAIATVAIMNMAGLS